MCLIQVLRIEHEGTVGLAGIPDHHANAQTEQVIKGAHPARVAAAQVVVDGDQVGATAEQRVQNQRQAGNKSLALPGLHFGDLAVVKHDASDKLDVEVTQADGSYARFPDQRERFDQQLVEVIAAYGLLAKAIGTRTKLVIAQG